MGWKKFNSRRKVRKKSLFLRKWFLIFCGSGLLLLVIGVLVAYFWSARYRERANNNNNYDLAKINEIEQPNKILDRSNREVGRIFSENRDPVPVEDVPQIFIDTLIAAEDARFFSHDGYDIKGIVRVAKEELFEGGSKSGGASTLTQQLARNAYHLQDEANRRKESTHERKVVEIFLAIRIEEKYTKHEILEFYLNRVNFGGGYHGIRSASLGYFGKEPRDLEVQECASLVGAIRNPAVFSPSRYNKNDEGEREQGFQNMKVRNRVLYRMSVEGVITEAESKEYQKRSLGLNPKPIQRGTSHFHDRVGERFKELLKENKISESDLAKGGFKIFTSIDKDIQETLENQLRDNLTRIENKEGYAYPVKGDYVRTEKSAPEYLQGAGMMIDHHTGEILAYVGGRNFTDSQYDFIASGKKPLGTAFFPFIYASALENGMNSSAKLIDEAMDNRRVMIDGVEGVLGEWGNEVLDPRYEGNISMRRSLATSKIAATVRLGRKVGLRKIWKTAERFGFEKPKGRLLNKTLLGSEEASLDTVVKAYGAFASQGLEQENLIWITRIEDGDGNEIYKWTGKGKTKEVIDRSSAFLVHTMLEDALKTGSGMSVYEGYGRSKLGDFSGGGKTGTTSDFSNHWFAGYNRRVTCAVWTGFYDGSRKEIYPEAFSRDTVMPAWIDAMAVAQKKFGDDKIGMPSDIVKLRICKHSGMLETKACEEFKHNLITGEKSYVSTGYDEYFQRSKRPRRSCPVHGASLGNFEDIDFGAGMTTMERLNTVPIKPQEPTLIGEDPYKSEASVYAPREKNFYTVGRGLNSLDFDNLVKENKVAEIPMPDLDRLKITD